jgi:hypothetical protein
MTGDVISEVDVVIYVVLSKTKQTKKKKKGARAGWGNN